MARVPYNRSRESEKIPTALSSRLDSSLRPALPEGIIGPLNPETIGNCD